MDMNGELDIVRRAHRAIGLLWLTIFLWLWQWWDPVEGAAEREDRNRNERRRRERDEARFVAELERWNREHRDRYDEPRDWV